MSDTVEQIKSRLDIVDVISGYLKVQKAGANYKARCPFHNEKTPSFHISPERQSWHCFGCGKGGDQFSFVQEIEGIDFVEALKILAGKAGVQLPAYRPSQARERDVRAPLLAVTDLAATFFAKQLWHSNAGTKALAYLRGRGMTDETIRAWNLGWAPNDWRALTEFMRSQGHAPASIVAAGMAVDKNGRLYDRFRSRIMFPICDANGQVVGFTGRVFGAQVTVNNEAPAKYVNTPQTAIYDKSRVLFGLDKAKLDMRRRDSCLLVEGNMDAIMASQAGATHVVATSGTALTPQQLQQLARYSTNLSFCFDTDQAGQTATRRGIGLALAQNFSIKVLTLNDPECKDPADYVAKYGERFTQVVSSATPVLQYYYDRAVAGYDPHSAESKKSIISAMGPLINRLTSNVERSHWIGQIALLVRTDHQSVQADVAAVRDDIAAHERTRHEPENTAASEAPVPLDGYNRKMLALVARFPELIPEVQKNMSSLDTRVVTLMTHPELLKPGADHPLAHLVDMACMEVEYTFEPPDTTKELAAIVDRLWERGIKLENAQLERDIQHAEMARDIVRRNELLQKFQHNHEELNRRRLS